ncbi:alpha/beta fold hydrolase [Streptomyces sp. NPDC089424]|uniref:alpha/beta fold hydrolase n=1 Tax=Streptomyces sp. NPDC089424 TaxID=3365917 RepID=UPI00380CB2DC
MEALRADPSPIASLTVPETVAHLEKVITELPEKPILIGHSFGGVLTQLLLDRGHAAAGVVIDSAPPQGIRVNPPSQLRSLFPIFTNPASGTGGGGLHPGAVPLRLHQHPARGRSAGGLRPVRHRGAGQTPTGPHWCPLGGGRLPRAGLGVASRQALSEAARGAPGS